MKIISLGLGVQSTALYYQSSMGILPRVDYAVFADPGREGRKTYEYLEYLKSWQSVNNGIQIIVKKDMNLWNDLLNITDSTKGRFASIPAFTKNEDGTTGMLRRQCTNEYKIMVVDNAIRELYGLEKYGRKPPTEVWKGITMDEIERVSIPQEKWKIQVYPYVDYRVIYGGVVEALGWENIQTRTDLIAWYNDNKLPIPPKSSCVFCPYRSDAGWYKMKNESPEDFADAVKIDEEIRNSFKKGIKQPIYIHNSCVPLSEVKFNQQNELPFGNCTDECNT